MSPVSRRVALRGAGIAGLLTAGGLLLPSTAFAISKINAQKGLWGLYYYDGVIDGYFGSMTVAAIKAFQRDRALVVDGYAGAITQRELVAVINAVQSKVGVVRDEEYGSVTIAAVKKKQAALGLYADGRAGAKTFAAFGLRRVVTTTSTTLKKLVVIDQMSTGYKAAENCGPTANVIAMVAVGRPPSTSYATAVQSMRTACNIPSGQWGTDLTQMRTGLAAKGVSSSMVSYAAGLDAAAANKVVILHVHHGRLIGSSTNNYGHYIVASGKNSSGDIRTSDPGRASYGIKGYSRSELVYARATGYDRALIVG